MSRPPPRSALRPAALFVAVAITVIIAACSAGPSTAGGPTPLADGTSPPSATPSGAISGSPAGVVEVPAGFPLPPGVVSRDVGATDGADVIARWSSDLVGPVVYEFYVDALPAAGFPISGLYPGGAVAVIVVLTPTGDPWQVVLTEDGGGTRIELRLAQP